MLAELNDEWTESRRYMGTEIPGRLPQGHGKEKDVTGDAEIDN